MSVSGIEADVVVAGGGLSGVFAAIAAARQGSETVLIHDRPVLGGNASSEIGVGISGADCSGGSLSRYARETGLIGEFALELLHRSVDWASAKPLHSVILWEMVSREPHLTVALNASVRGAETDETGAITSVRICQITTEREYAVSGRMFIDCTGHGTLGAAAGAEFRMGREARREFGESMAPEEADNDTMGCSLIFEARDMGHPVPFEPPNWAVQFPTDKDLPFRHPTLEKVDQKSDMMRGFWWIEYGGTCHTIQDAEAIHSELLRVLYGVWDHMKNTGDHGVENYAIMWISSLPGQRESRRLIGDYIMTENDVRSRILFPDRVGFAGWPIDLHPPEGIYSKEPPCTHEFLPNPCSVPFRSLYSKDVSNLLFAGRDVSVTHVALGTVRVMGTCAIMGQAAGTAAALCCRCGLSPGQLRRERITELQQQLLRDDCYIIAMPNDDPEDLARTARASATSEAEFDASSADEWHELLQPCAQIFPVSAEQIHTVELLLRSSLSKSISVRLGLRVVRTINDVGQGEDIASVEAAVPPEAESWVPFPLNAGIQPGCFCRIHLSLAPGVFWAVQAQPPHGTNRALYDPGQDPVWRSISPRDCRHGLRGAFVLRLSPSSWPYGPANVLSGVNRPEQGTNLWISDRAKPLPQTLELTLPNTTAIGRIHVVFDDDLDTNVYLPPPWGRLGKGIMPTLVRDYRLLVMSDGIWREIVHVENNHQRRRVHTLSPMSTNHIRLECLATHGVPEARVYEVRVYGPDTTSSSQAE